MPQLFALDVCYKSDVSPADATHPIATAYGFVEVQPLSQGIGEKVDLSINAGDDLCFTIFDIADNPASISSIVISVNDVTPPNNPNNPILGGNPFGWLNGTQTFQNLTFTDPNGQSGGCNMRGHGLSLGSFTAQAAPGKKNKTYDITITITVNMPDGSTRVFQVDPEVDVMAE